MPWISPIFEKAVIYLFGLNPKTKEWVLGGSGFLFGFPSDRDGPNHVYAITNQHVAVGNGFSSIRLHGRNGLDFIELEPHEWTYLPEDDLAVVDITDFKDPTKDQIAVINAVMAVSQEYASQAEIGFGDDVFMVGMFAVLKLVS